MDIVITLKNTGDPNLPDGVSILFEDVDDYKLESTRGVKDVTCREAGCGGCRSVHRRVTDESRLSLVARGSASNGPRWVMPLWGSS